MVIVILESDGGRGVVRCLVGYIPLEKRGSEGSQ
jgi:hypothetical protein